jgi:hypothetical protein
MRKKQIDYATSDFTSVVIGLAHDLTCEDARKDIADGKKILRYLRQKKRMPNPNTMERWKKALKFEKRICKRYR